MKIFIGCFFAVFAIGFGIFFATPRTQGQKEQDGPTVIKKGQITDKERGYSKEYKKLYGNRSDKKLTALKQKGGLGIVIGPADVAHSSDEPAITANQFLERLACRSDAIVIGAITSKSSHLSDDETFVYSEYDFKIENVIKDNLVSPITSGNTISVARPGGFIKIDEQLIKFDDASYKSLQRNKEYILFLKFLPIVNGYVVADPEGDFIIENKAFKTLSSHGLPNGLEEGIDSGVLVNMVQSAALSNCSQDLLIDGGKDD